MKPSGLADPSFAAQQLLVPPILSVGALFCLAVFVPVHTDRIEAVANSYPGLFGIFLARAINARWSNASHTGTYIFAVPTIIWIYEVMFVEMNTPVSQRVLRAFQSSGSGEGLQLAFEAVPMVGTILYSATMLLLRRAQPTVLPSR